MKRIAGLLLVGGIMLVGTASSAKAQYPPYAPGLGPVGYPAASPGMFTPGAYFSPVTFPGAYFPPSFTPGAYFAPSFTPGAYVPAAYFAPVAFVPMGYGY